MEDKTGKERGRRIVELGKEIKAMPEYQLDHRLRMLDWSLSILVRNFQELWSLLRMCGDLQKVAPLWERGNRDRLPGAQAEVVRLLHNYVAGARTMVDHTRRLYRHLSGERCWVPGYEERVAEDFAANPLVQFVEELRDFCLHYDVPPVVSRLQYTRSSGQLQPSVRLERGKLKKWDGWSRLGLEYLNGQADDIELSEVVGTYHAKVMDFQRWFRVTLATSLREEMSSFHAKQQELADLVIPDQIEMALAEIGTQHIHPNVAFSGILHPAQRAELEAIPIQSSGYRDKLLVFLEGMATLEPQLKLRIATVLAGYQQQVSTEG